MCLCVASTRYWREASGLSQPWHTIGYFIGKDLSEYEFGDLSAATLQRLRTSFRRRYLSEAGLLGARANGAAFHERFGEFVKHHPEGRRLMTQFGAKLAVIDVAKLLQGKRGATTLSDAPAEVGGGFRGGVAACHVRAPGGLGRWFACGAHEVRA